MRSVLCCWVVGVFWLRLKLVGALPLPLPACQSSAEERQTEHKFHSDHTCNRMVMNDAASLEARQLRKMSFTPSQSMKISREQTLYCPTITTHEALLLDQEKDLVMGHKEGWILNNEATTPVSISFWDQEERRLVSAFNPDISPAHHDPHSIVNPGRWATVTAWQGHVFVMHQLEWVEGQLVQGRILATHRVGLVPIGAQFEPPPKMADISPLTDAAPETTASSTHKDLNERTPPNLMEFCNVLHKGFINEANFPLDLYFAGRRSDFSNQNKNSSSNHKMNETTLLHDDANDWNNLPSCQQKFKFHLGVHHNSVWHEPSQDPHHSLDDWQSPLKYEGTYVSHTFVARLQHDPSIIVEEYTVSPVTVRDCSKQDDDVNESVISMIPMQVDISMGSTNPSSFYIASSLHNSTHYKIEKNE
eukprot:scaffold296224_cov51-Attheya_sp.AAC.1